jgi:hypothetical protein
VVNLILLKIIAGAYQKIFCKKCNQYFYDWSNSGICPNCDGILTGLKKSRIISGLFLTPPLNDGIEGLILVKLTEKPYIP